MRINTNIPLMAAVQSTKNTNNSLTGSLEKLSSGLKINKAADDASGLAIADKLRTQASSVSQGIDNLTSALAMIQIADKAMAEQSNILDIVKQKFIQAATSTTSDDGREAIRRDVVKLLEQFDHISASTNYNGITLLQMNDEIKTKANPLEFQFGEAKDFRTSLLTGAVNSLRLGGDDTILQPDAVYKNTGNGFTSDDTYKVLYSKEVLNIKTSNGTSFSPNMSKDLDDTLIYDYNPVPHDIYVSGIIGSLKLGTKLNSGTSPLMYFEATKETKEVQELVKKIALNTTGVTEISNNVYTLDPSSDPSIRIDFGEIEFNNLRIFQGDYEKGVSSYIGSVGFNGLGIYADFTVSTKVSPSYNNDFDNKLKGIGMISVANDKYSGGYSLETIKLIEKNKFTVEKANKYMETINISLTQLNTIRSDFGSSQIQMESTIRNLFTIKTSLKNAESVIRDADYSEESANFSKQNIVLQAGTYVQSQASQIQQNILKLLK